MPVVAVQDDAREKEMLERFRLDASDEGRGGTDAFLTMDKGGQPVPFELKSTSTTSVTTVRDFGADHIEKFKLKHWLIAFYDRQGTRILRCIYGTPLTMKPWLDGREAYIRPDLVLVNYATNHIGMDAVYEILGDCPKYSLKDARSVQKKQMKIENYQARMDLPNGYSQKAMLQIVGERFAYLVKRGATLNNPHINASYFTDSKKWPGTEAGATSWRKLDMNRPAEHLRELVAAAVTVKEDLSAAEQEKLERETSTIIEEFAQDEDGQSQQF